MGRGNGWGIAGGYIDIIIKKKQMLVEVLSQATKCPLETVEAAIDRDTWFSAEEAASFGLIDSVSNDWCVEEGFADAS